jgi:hypothetical protein
MSTATPGQWHQIEALFAAALDTPAGERTALQNRRVDCVVVKAVAGGSGRVPRRERATHGYQRH